MARASTTRNRLPLEQVRWRLGTIWLTGSGFIVALLIFQSLTGVYEHRVQGVWGWALPNFVPTLSLMIGVFGATALDEDARAGRMRVSRPFVRLAVGLSLFHLFCVALTLLAHPFTGTFQRDANGEVDMMAVFDISALWLAPLQGLVAATIGALFFSSKEGKAGADEGGDPAAGGG